MNELVWNEAVRISNTSHVPWCYIKTSVWLVLNYIHQITAYCTLSSSLNIVNVEICSVSYNCCSYTCYMHVHFIKSNQILLFIEMPISQLLGGLETIFENCINSYFGNPMNIYPWQVFCLLEIWACLLTRCRINPIPLFLMIYNVHTCGCNELLKVCLHSSS